MSGHKRMYVDIGGGTLRTHGPGHVRGTPICDNVCTCVNVSVNVSVGTNTQKCGCVLSGCKEM